MAEPRRRQPPATPSPPPDVTPPRRRRALNPARQPGMVQVTHTDAAGRRWAVLVPVGHEQDGERGVVLGPPDVREVLPDLPEAIALRLHDELFNRGLFSEPDLRGRAAEVQAALQAALQLDVQALMSAYRAE